ncbi:MAG: CBS domain-containing protein, partial [Halovenus sp.]
MDIADIATSDYKAVDADERLGKVRSMFERDRPTGLIVTVDGNYEGVITQRQLVQSHIEDSAKVRGLIQSAPRVELTDSVREVARILVESGTKIAPVFQDGELTRVVSGDDILEAVLENLDALDVSEI